MTNKKIRKIKMIKKILQGFFSIRNSENKKHKIICILGLKIKIRLKKDYEKIITKTKIQKNKIVFNNFNGKSYGCNPKYIAQEIIRQKLPYKLVWLVKDIRKHKNEFPKEIKLVEWNVKNAIKEFASAKIWINNQRMPELYENSLFKKNGQFYIQTWHGAALKQIEKDVEKEKVWWCNWAKVDSKYIDLLLTAGKGEKKVFEHNFYFKGEITSNGLPRDSVFYMDEKEKEKTVEKIYKKYNIPRNKKIILYAPTFRDNGRTSVYNIDCKSLLQNIKDKFNNDFVLLIRLHPNEPKEVVNIFSFNEDIINVTDYSDIQEILLASEILVTDYSSCMFDFMLTRKPVFLFMSDLEEYRSERNFYINFEDLPFSIAYYNNDLMENIKTFNDDNYKTALNEFIDKRGYADSNMMISYILEKIKDNMGK